MPDRSHRSLIHSNESRAETSSTYAHMGTWQTTSQNTPSETQMPIGFASNDLAENDYTQQTTPSRQRYSNTSLQVQYDNRSEQDYYSIPRPSTNATPSVLRMLNNSEVNYRIHSNQGSYQSNYQENIHATHTRRSDLHLFSPQSSQPLTFSTLQNYEYQTAGSGTLETWMQQHPRHEPWNVVGAVGRGTEYDSFDPKL